MNSICISTEPEPAVASPLVLPMPQAHLKAGFPSPAEDFTVNRLDLTQILVSHPQATFLMRVSGTSMQDAGIDDKTNSPRYGSRRKLPCVWSSATLTGFGYIPV